MKTCTVYLICIGGEVCCTITTTILKKLITFALSVKSLFMTPDGLLVSTDEINDRKVWDLTIGKEIINSQTTQSDAGCCSF